MFPDPHFEVHNLFNQHTEQFKQKANIIFVSHILSSSDNISILLRNLKDFQASQDTLLIFVNDNTGGDAQGLPFFKEKPSSDINQVLKDVLSKEGYHYIEMARNAKINFPELTLPIRNFILSIKRGDYENPYPNIDKNLRVFKGLMEFIASCPLECLSLDQITQ